MKPHSHRPQIFAFNLIRSVAILMVVLDHCMRRDINPDVDYLIRLIINPDAAIFFMVSGALLMPVTGSYGHFMRHRIVKVFVPFVVWVITYALVYYMLGMLNEQGLANQIRWDWMSYNFIQGWFIPDIMALYFIMPLISPWIANASRRNFHYVLVIWLVSGLLPLFEALGGVNPRDTPLQLFFNCVPYAIIGFYLFKYRYRQPLLPAYVVPVPGEAQQMSAARRKARLRKLIVLYTLVFLIGVILPFALRNSANSIDLRAISLKWNGLPAIVMAIFYFSTLIKVKTLGPTADKIVNFISRRAYGIFLCHWLISGLLMPRFLPDLASSTPATLAITLTGSIILTSILRAIPFLGRYII